MRVFFTGTIETTGLQAGEAKGRWIEVGVLARQNEAGGETALKEGGGDGGQLDGFRPGADDQPNVRVIQPSP
jgi:hypothetical protein